MCTGDIPANSGGSTEEDELNPDGEYGQSCLGRERVMEYYSKKNNTPMLQFRLNYAVALRYGVLYDIANAVNSGEPVSLGRSIFNCIWQGDVCEYAIRSLLHTAVPPVKLNVTGPETISTKWAAEEFGRMLGKTPVFSPSEPAPGGVFSNSSKMVEWMGYPQTSLRQMMHMQADWIKAGQSSIHAPTHFETVDGKY